MIERLLDAGALTIPGLRLLQYGSAPIRPATLARAVSALPGVRFINTFGQTEESPIACLVPEDHERALTGQPDLLASVGRAAPRIELRLENPDGNGVGEILAKGDHLFKLAEDGWLHTSDLATMDAEGYVYLAGRLGDRIKRGGENVHPVEVEDVLREHPAVLEIAAQQREVLLLHGHGSGVPPLGPVPGQDRDAVADVAGDQLAGSGLDIHGNLLLHFISYIIYIIAVCQQDCARRTELRERERHSGRDPGQDRCRLVQPRDGAELPDGGRQRRH